MSHLLLWRHADALDVARGGDLMRPLTAHGREQAVQGAQWIHGLARAHGWKLNVIASPALRAQQTAAALGMDVATDPALAPGESAAGYLAHARPQAGRDEALVVVGHQPSLGVAVAQLLVGSAHTVSVRKAAVWWFVLRGREDAPVVLRGVWTPD